MDGQMCIIMIKLNAIEVFPFCDNFLVNNNNNFTSNIKTPLKNLFLIVCIVNITIAGLLTGH